MLEDQFAVALAAMEPEPETVEGPRRALRESLEREQEYRRTTLEALRRRQDEVESGRTCSSNDTLMTASLKRNASGSIRRTARNSSQ